jgi:phosphohistidine swiveling domain-containing protein
MRRAARGDGWAMGVHMTRFILNWSQAFEAGLPACGGKGYHLARLRRYGFPVPDGGVVVAEVYRRLLQEPVCAEPARELAAVRAEAVLEPAVQARLLAIRQAIEATDLRGLIGAELEGFLRRSGLTDRPMAVRSSAVSEDGPHASFAGIHQSVLHVRGSDAICAAILTCFASLWTPQAVAYRRRQAYTDDDVLCAVVLCAMVCALGAREPESAGVAFSCDPRTGRRDLIVIDAGRGPGERVVSGVVHPQQIELRLARGRFTRQPCITSEAPVLTPAQEHELAHHVWRIHWALGEGDHPQDVEWASDGRQLWILQSRPVTGLPRPTFAAVAHLPVMWSTANIKDAVPGVVSMFSWSMIQETVDAILYATPRLVGCDIPPGMQTTKRIDGHAYFDLTAIQWCWYDYFGVRPAQTAAVLGGHQPEIPVPEGDPLAGREGRRRKRTLLRTLWHLLGFSRRFRHALQRHDTAVRALAALPWGQLSEAALHDAVVRMVALHERLEPLVGFANGYASAFMRPLARQLDALAGERAPGLLARLLAGSGQITSAEQGYRLVDLARVAQRDPAALAWLRRCEPPQEWRQLAADSPFRRELARFLEEFGHRAVYEADVLNPRWRDDPSYLLDQVRRLLDRPLDADPRLSARQVSAAAWAEVSGLTFWRRPLLKRLVQGVQRGFAMREVGKSAMVATLGPARHLMLELGRRLVELGHLQRPEQAFHLSQADVLALLRGYWDGRGAGALTQDRGERREAWLKRRPADVIIEETEAHDPTPLQAPLVAPGGPVWSGIGVSSGRATAVARVILHPAEGARLGHGEILVAPSTDPGWTPLFLRASAVVMETGGYLSHGAIVAREYGLPAVVNIPGIVDLIVDGETLTVDGDAATVGRSL